VLFGARTDKEKEQIQLTHRLHPKIPEKDTKKQNRERTFAQCAHARVHGQNLQFSFVVNFRFALKVYIPCQSHCFARLRGVVWTSAVQVFLDKGLVRSEASGFFFSPLSPCSCSVLAQLFGTVLFRDFLTPVVCEMKSTVVHSKPVVEVRGEVELLDKTLLGKRFKPAFFEQDCDTNSFSLVEGRTTSSYSLSSVQKLHTEGDIVVIGVGGGGTTVAFRVLDGAMASRWVNLLAQWVSYLRQVSLGQVLGEASSGGNTALGNSGGLRDTSAGGVSDIVFQSGGAKAFGGVWDDDLFLKLRGRVLQYHRAEEDDDVLGYVACSGISGVSQLGLRDDGRMHVVRIMFRSASERPWELGFDTRTLAQEWQRVLMSMSGGASLLATMGRQVGKKIFKKKEDSFGSSSLNAGFVGTPFNVTKQTPLSPRKPASLQGENEQQQVRGGWNSKQPSQLGEERKKEKEQERKEREMKSKAKESEQYSTYGDIDVDVLRLQLEEDVTKRREKKKNCL
jgi:hypothetical protein